MVSSSEQPPRDGLIDFSKYTTEQLIDLQYSVDRTAYPLNHRNLLAELENRQHWAGEEPAIGSRFPVRFTRRHGILGWLEALAGWKRLYGDGWIELGTDETSLHGWRRTWLGVPQRTIISIPLTRSGTQAGTKAQHALSTADAG